LIWQRRNAYAEGIFRFNFRERGAFKMATQSTQAAQTVASPGQRTWLRNVLFVDALFCALGGVVFAVGATPLATLTGMSAAFVVVIGVGLVVWATVPFMAARREPTNPGTVMFVVVVNVAWVVASIILLIADPFLLTTEGKWFTLIIADAVAALAVLQYIGVRRLART
jgi:hypothetical protein